MKKRVNQRKGRETQKTLGRKAPTKAPSAPAQVFEDLTTGDEETGAVPVSASTPMARQWVRLGSDGQLETYELLPYARSVEDLWHRLCEADVPIPMGRALRNLDAFASCAIKLLFLLSHTPAEYRHLRASTPHFLEAIEAWGNVNVPREKTSEAVVLVLAIHNGAHGEGY